MPDSDGAARRLRDLLAEPNATLIGGAHDALTARLAEEAGFGAVWASGLEISAAHGVPDISLLGLAEFVSAGAIMARSVAVPVIADCDTGFGGELNVAYTVQRYEAVGVAAVCFEDKIFPKRNSFLGAGHQLLKPADFARNIRAAKAAQERPATVVVARTEALVCGRPLEEALARCHAYVDAGADAVLIHSKASEPREVLAFLESWQRRAPAIVVPTTYASLTAEDAAAAGASAVIYANQAMRASVAAVRDAWRRVVAEGTTANIEDGIAAVADVFALSGMDSWLARETSLSLDS